MTITTSSSDLVNAQIGRRVRTLAFGRKTQLELAEAIGVDQSSMSRRIHGKTDWSPRELVITAKELGVTVGDLFGEGRPKGWPLDYGGKVSALHREREKHRPASVVRPRGRADDAGPKRRAA